MEEKDLQAIGNLLDKKLDEKFEERIKPIENRLKPIEEKLDSHTSSLMKIEQKIDAALELRQDVSEVREQVKNHEERLSSLETH